MTDFLSYFKQAQSWDVDRLMQAQRAAQRWFIAFCGISLLAIILGITLMLLLPLKTLVPMIVQHNLKTGELWVKKPANPYVPENTAQIQADLVRYVVTRESYSALDLNQRFHLVLLLSDSDVADHYIDAQANNNLKAPVNVFGAKGSCTVEIEDVVFLGEPKTLRLHQPKIAGVGRNLAKVDFSRTCINAQGQASTDYWVATIGWAYRGLPEDPQSAWDNWNGFTVTTYRVDPRQILSHPSA